MGKSNQFFVIAPMAAFAKARRTSSHIACRTAPAQWIHANLEVQFAGQTAHYTNVPFERSQQGNEVRIAGTIPLTCSDFKIVRPSFLTVPIKNEIPVRVDMTWHQQ